MLFVCARELNRPQAASVLSHHHFPQNISHCAATGTRSGHNTEQGTYEVVERKTLKKKKGG